MSLSERQVPALADPGRPQTASVYPTEESENQAYQTADGSNKLLLNM
jgi:hypothetical protein